MGDRDFKYVIQDMTNIFLGARFTYAELMEEEEVPHKLKEVIFRIFLQEVAEDTTLENHVFFLTKESASYKAFKKMKAKFRMSVWESASAGPGGRKKSGYVNREYTLEEIVDSPELHRKMDAIVVEELHISKLGLAALIV